MTAAEKALDTLEVIRKLKMEGQNQQALQMFCQHEKALPQVRGAFYLKGTIYQDLGAEKEALKAYKDEITYNPKCVEAHINTGVIHFQAERFPEAIASFKLAILLGADQYLPYYNLAGVMQKLSRLDEAIVYYTRALHLKPDALECWINLSGIYRRLEDKENTIRCYQAILKIRPENQTAIHMLQSLGGQEKTLTRAQEKYVERLFDTYAESFETSLIEKLNYRAPELVKHLIEKIDQNPLFTRALDLGCGTGLAAQTLKSISKTWIGVDLSANMLAVAEKKDIYQDLIQDDIFQFLANSPHPYETDHMFDLIIALDVIPYIGDLKPFFAGIKRLLHSQAWVILSTEKSSSISTYELAQAARFQHNSLYVIKEAETVGLTLKINEAKNIRQNEGEPVKGDLFIFQAPNADIKGDRK